MEPALHTTELTYQEKTKLNQYVTEIIEKHKKNAADIDILVNDSVYLFLIMIKNCLKIKKYRILL
ncbi:MAG TPA: hypothetical protein PKN87_04835 [Syntrophomonadaceae bacterium]|nr:hypothetical protein [Syntrophomonadaceae bacterium]HPR92819.1 hypothetical protein [Syntrophomonadaceae bacterium]